MSELAQEQEVFDGHLAEWRSSHLGDFVLIKDTTVVGFYRSLEEAFAEGTKRFGLQDFFIRLIAPDDSVSVSLCGASVLAD